MGCQWGGSSWLSMGTVLLGCQEEPSPLTTKKNLSIDNLPTLLIDKKTEQGKLL